MRSAKYTFFLFASKVIAIYPKLISAILRPFCSEPKRIVMRLICKGMESKRHHISFRIVPKNSLEIPVADLNNNSQTNNAFAIVLQGPIPKDLTFIINTIRYYKKTYVGSTIIVSTWDDENMTTISSLKDEGIVVVLSQKPISSGINNVNYQIVNSLAGVKKAKELGCEYVVKTRTDQRICKPYLFNSMRTMIEKIPTYSNSGQRKRMVLLANNHGNMFAPYFMSDFLYFGQIDDMVNLFSAPLDTRKPYKLDGYSSQRDHSRRMYPPEVYLLKHYLQDHLGYDCEDTVKAYWEAVKDYLICYSMKEADILWPKYNGQYESNFLFGEYFGANDSDEHMATMCFDLPNWLNLYFGTLKYKEEYEKYADAPMLIKSGFSKK